MSRYDAVIFDLDGTLLDTLEDLKNSVNYALGEMGWPQRSLDEIRAFVGNGVDKLMERAVPADTSAADTARALDIFKPHYALHSKDLTAPYPGVAALMGTLRQKGYKLAVVSNKFDDAVKELAREYFPGLLHTAAGECQERGVPKKPHPAMVLHALEELGVPAERAVYVGDSDVDLLTAKNAGLPCISVTWGFRDRAFLTARGAVAFADTPEQVLELLEQ